MRAGITVSRDRLPDPKAENRHPSFLPFFRKLQVISASCYPIKDISCKPDKRSVIRQKKPAREQGRAGKPVNANISNLPEKGNQPRIRTASCCKHYLCIQDKFKAKGNSLFYGMEVSGSLNKYVGLYGQIERKRKRFRYGLDLSMPD